MARVSVGWWEAASYVLATVLAVLSFPDRDVYSLLIAVWIVVVARAVK
jgi:hypothetical protein